MKKLKLFIINSFILTISALIIRSIGMFYNVYISNKIGAEAVGIFQIVMSIYVFAITLASSGINFASNKIVAEELTKNNVYGAKIALKKCIYLSLTVSAISSITLSLSANLITKQLLHNKISPSCFYFIALGLPFISVSSAINGYFSAVRRVIKTSISQILEHIVKILVTMYLLNFMLPKGIENACLALVISDVISELFSFLMIFFFYKIDKRKYLKCNTTLTEKNYNTKILKIVIPIAITSYIKSGLSTLKQVLIPLRLERFGLSSSDSLSKYGIINGMALPTLLFPNVIITTFSSLLITEFTYFYTKKDFISIKKYTNYILKISCLFSVGIMGIFLSFPNELSSTIYNNPETAIYFKLLSPLIILIYIDIIVDGLLKGLDKQVDVMKCNIIDLVTSIAFIYLLLPILGVKGYIIVLFISETLNFAISLYILIKNVKIKFDVFNFIIKPFIGVYIAKFLTKFIFLDKFCKTENSLIKLFLLITIFLFFYTLYLYLAKIITKKDLNLKKIK